MQVIPYTVLMMVPEYWFADQSTKSDYVTRIYVEADSPEDAVEKAYSAIPESFPDEEDLQVEDFEPVAVYMGHIFDLYQP